MLASARETGEGAAGSEVRLCALEYAAGRIEECLGSECPFWGRGGPIVAPGCALSRLEFDLEGNAELRHWLLRIRAMLSEAMSPAEEQEALHLFRPLLPPGLRE